jgi:peptidoglycan-N-acetylglucosamine deacetylase
MFYFVKQNWLVKKVLPKNLVWQLPDDEDRIYLSFDDGPHPTITPWVLDLLKQYNCKASFFCIGDNVRKYPQVYQRILAEGHAVGNHTFRHLNGWQTDTETYLHDVRKAQELIKSNLFRPPYGRIKTGQANFLIEQGVLGNKYQIIMWDILSGDFDTKLTAEQCTQNVVLHAEPGSIVVFHDSEKAYPRLQACLPKVLTHINNNKWKASPIIIE